MMHIRGHPSDYDGWAAGGATGWTYKDCLPYFQKLENQDDDTSPWAGHGGSAAGQQRRASTTRTRPRGPSSTRASSSAIRRPRTSTGRTWSAPAGITSTSSTASGSRPTGPTWSRRSVAPNLTFETDALATKLIIEDGRCTGVEYRKGSRTHRAHTQTRARSSSAAARSNRRSCCCCPGSATPTELKALGIEPTVDLPGVGKNFHNHVLTGVIHESPQPVPPGKQNLSESAMFVKSDPAETGPDLQIAFVHVPFNIIVGQGHPNSISILPGVVRPQSRGSVKLASADPTVPPARRPELPRRPERPREAGRGGQDRARASSRPRRSRRGSAPS